MPGPITDEQYDYLLNVHGDRQPANLPSDSRHDHDPSYDLPKSQQVNPDFGVAKPAPSAATPAFKQQEDADARLNLEGRPSREKIISAVPEAMDGPKGQERLPSERELEPHGVTVDTWRKPSVPIYDDMQKLRLGGMRFDEIKELYTNEANELLKSGFTKQEIAQFYGFNPFRKGGFDSMMQFAARQANGYATSPGAKADESFLGNLAIGLQQSGPGLAAAKLSGKGPAYLQQLDENSGSSFKAGFGRASGAIAGGLIQYGKNAAPGAAIAGLAVQFIPGVGELVDAAVLGGVLGGATSFGLTATENKLLSDSIKYGDVTSPGHFAERAGSALWDTKGDYLVGGVIGPFGAAGRAAGGALTGAFEGRLEKAGVDIVRSLKQRLAMSTGQAVFEIAGMTGTQAAVDRKWPGYQDVMTNSMFILGAHLGPAALKGIPRFQLQNVTDNLFKILRNTGELPGDVRERASKDPGLAQRLRTTVTAETETGPNPAIELGNADDGGISIITNRSMQTSSPSRQAAREGNFTPYKDGDGSAPNKDKPLKEHAGKGVYGSDTLMDPGGFAYGGKVGRPDIHPEVINWFDAAMHEVLPGWTARLRAGPANHTEGTYTGGARSQVTLGMAADIELIDPEGKVHEPYALREFRTPEQNAQDPMYNLYKKLGDAYIRHSGGKGRWGGYYGQPDLMQFGTIGDGYGAGQNFPKEGVGTASAGENPTFIPGETFDDAHKRLLRANAPDGEQYPGTTFEKALPSIWHNEGGVGWGVDNTQHPEAWSADGKTGPDLATATKVMHQHWVDAGIDDMPANIRLQAFDIAVLEGPKAARDLVAAAGGDPYVLWHMRRDALIKIAERKPEHAKDLKGWLNRADAMGPDGAGWQAWGADGMPKHPGKTYTGGGAPDPMFKPSDTWKPFNDRRLDEREGHFGDQLAHIIKPDGTVDAEHAELRQGLQDIIGKWNPITAGRSLDWAEGPASRGDISQALVDRAKGEAEVARENFERARDAWEQSGRAIDPITGEDKPMPAALIEKQKLADEREKEATAFEDKTGRRPQVKSKRVVEMLQARHPQPRQHQTVHTVANAGDGALRVVAHDPETADYLANAQVIKVSSLPYTASASSEKGSNRVYVHEGVPDKGSYTTKDGRKATFNPIEGVVTHEVMEHAAQMRLKEARDRGLIDWSDGKIYAIAHKEIANVAEKEVYKRQLGDKYDGAAIDKWWEPHEKRAIENTKGPFPPDMVRDEYPRHDPSLAGHDHDVLETYTPEEARQAKMILIDQLGRQEPAPVVVAKRGKGFAAAKGPATGMFASKNPLLAAPTSTAQAVKTILGRVNMKLNVGPQANKKDQEAGLQKYIEAMDDNAALRKLQDVLLNRTDKMGVKLHHFRLPSVALRLAEEMPSIWPAHIIQNSGPLKFIFKHGQNTLDTTPTGTKPLLDLLGGNAFDSPEELQHTYALLLSYRALELDAKGLRTPIDIASARYLVQAEEAKSVTEKPKFQSPQDLANATHPGSKPPSWTIPGLTPVHIGGGVNLYHSAHPLMKTIGPHYDPSTGNVNMIDPIQDNEWYRSRGTDYNEVLWHELGHRAIFEHTRQALRTQETPDIIDHLKSLGFDEQDLREVSDELHINSLRFKPGMWKNYRQDIAAQGAGHHFNKWSEMLADAAAMYIRDPDMRPHMPKLLEMLPELKKFGKAPEGDNWGTPALRRIHEVHKFQNEMERMKRDAGVLSDDGFQKMIADNRHYIPGYTDTGDREAHDEAMGRTVHDAGFLSAPRRGGRGFSAFNPNMKAYGHNIDLQHMLFSMMANVYTDINASMRTIVNNRIADTVKVIQGMDHANGKLADGNLIERVEEKTFMTTLTDKEIESVGGVAKGYDFNRKILRKYLDHQVKTNEIKTFEDGKAVIYRFANAQIPAALKALGAQHLPHLAESITKIADWQRTVISSTPDFGLRLGLHDFMQNIGANPEAGLKVAVASHIRGVVELLKGMGLVSGKSWTADMMMSPAADAFRHFSGMTRDQTIKHMIEQGHQLDGTTIMPNTTITALDHLRMSKVAAAARVMSHGLIRNAVRGRYSLEREAGKSMTEAGILAGNMQLHRKNMGGTVGKAANRYTPFIQAHLQELNVFAKNTLGDKFWDVASASGFKEKAKAFWSSKGQERVPVRTDLGTKYVAGTAALTALLTYTLPALMAAVANDLAGNEDPPWWIGDHAISVPLPNFHFNIPVAGAKGFFFVGIPIRMYHAIRDEMGWFGKGGKGSSNTAGLLPSFIESFIPKELFMGPNIFNTTYGLLNNIDFTSGRPLITDAEAKRDHDQQFSSNTSETAKSIAQGLENILGGDAMVPSPKVIDKVLDIAGGNVGRWGRDIGDTLLRQLNLGDPKPFGYSLTDFPAFRGTMERNDKSPISKADSEFGERLKKGQQMQVSMSDLYGKDNFARFKMKVLNDPVNAVVQFKAFHAMDAIAAEHSHVDPRPYRQLMEQVSQEVMKRPGAQEAITAVLGAKANLDILWKQSYALEQADIKNRRTGEDQPYNADVAPKPGELPGHEHDPGMKGQRPAVTAQERIQLRDNINMWARLTAEGGLRAMEKLNMR